MARLLRLTLAAFLLSFPAGAAEPTDEAWTFTQLRKWLVDASGPGRGTGDTAAALARFPELKQDSADFKEVAAQLTGGCALQANDEGVAGRLVSWDLDADGAAELVFAGGCSPSPFFAVFTGPPGARKLLHRARGRLLAVERRAGQLVFVAAHDGYGIEREASLELSRLSPARALEFRMVEPSDAVLDGPVTACATKRNAALRTSAAVDDRPQETGFGGDYPGNLFQRLERGSTGWRIGSAKVRGRSWVRCVFTAPARPEFPEQQLAAMKKPVRLERAELGAQAEQSFLVGWVAADDVAP